jgi:NitT/TauT family transport system permease protein
LTNNSGETKTWTDRLSGKILLGSVLPLVVILAWWYGIRSGTAVVPAFGDVFRVLLHPFETPPDLYSRSLAFSLMMTLLRLAIGFGLAAATAIPLGFLAGRSRIADRVLYPVVQMARPINPVVLLPIATVLFGLSSLASLAAGALDAWKHDVWDQVQIAMVFILWWGAFFPIFIATVHGVRTVRTAYIETMSLFGASDGQTMKKVVLPHALPSIVNGMRIALGVAWLVLIAAELFPGTRSGIGYMLCTACKTSDYQYTFAAMIVIGVVGLAMDAGIHRLERRVSHWLAAER